MAVIIFLFAGSDAERERAAAIYSLLGAAKLNGLDPEIYLQHVLERIADHPISKINELLPWSVSLTKQTKSSYLMYPHNLMWIHSFDTPHRNGSDHTLTV